MSQEANSYVQERMRRRQKQRFPNLKVNEQVKSRCGLNTNEILKSNK